MSVEEPEALVAPNWLKELEAKRERRVKAKLGHETGAGAACLTCSDKCPGLDLHFWRKICKNCKCSKEEHDVPDDDVHGWAEWQLLGKKPQKIRTKITLPGRKGEVELEWAPKGAHDTVQQFLSTLPPEQMAIKGSQAALDRKLQLQKQIPVHDIDPGLCHDLTAQELEEMQKYIAHVKEKSVGVGQLVRLGHLIHGVLHSLEPQEAQLLTQKYGKNVPFYEVVKLQNQLMTNQLVKEMDQLNVNKSLPNYRANSGVKPEEVQVCPVKLGPTSGYCDNQSPRRIGNLRDLAYSTYERDDVPNSEGYSPNHNSKLGNLGQNMPVYQQQFGQDLGNHGQLPMIAEGLTRSNPKLPNYSPQLGQNEQNLEPTNVQIGAIRDIQGDIKTASFGQNRNFIENLPTPQEATTTIIDNLVMPNCHGCQKPFELEEFAVTIEKSNNLYHASCFKCAGCHQILADNMYFYHKETNNIYCLRDYAKVKGYPRCKGCDELIFTKEYCLTEENTFHLKHFCCIECDTPLAGQNYLEENSHPMCLPCYEQGKANRCLGCQKVIKPDEKGLMLKDSHFHADDQCFSCKICKKPLLQQKLLFRDQKLYCSHQCHQTDQPQQ